MGRTFAIGDVHGCEVALDTLLGMLELAADDRIVQLGDLCDRGPGTAGVIDILMGLSEELSCRVLLGNHDEMMLGVAGRGGFRFSKKLWLEYGGKETLASYPRKKVEPAHLDWLEQNWLYDETDTEVFVHAHLEHGVPLDVQAGEELRWVKLTGGEPRFDADRRVICGHTAQGSGEPWLFDGWACIDTKVYSPTGWLTALDVTNDVVYQANQRGETRGPMGLAVFDDGHPGDP